mgnify:CR=1 FL=1
MPLRAVRAARVAEPPAPPVIEAAAQAALEHYLDHLAQVRRRSAFTLRNYRTDLEDWLRFLAVKGVAHAAAGRSHGRAYLSHLQDDHVAEGSIRRRATSPASTPRAASAPPAPHPSARSPASTRTTSTTPPRPAPPTRVQSPRFAAAGW